MASWSGTPWNRAAQSPSLEAWTKSRSEYCPFDSRPPSSQPEELQWDDKEMISTASWSLHRRYPLPSDGPALGTAPTAPMFSPAGQEVQQKNELVTADLHWLTQDVEEANELESSSQSSASDFPCEHSLELSETINRCHLPAPPSESAQEISLKVTRLIAELFDAHKDLSTERYRIREIRRMLRQKRDEEGDVRIILQSQLNLISAENVHDDIAAVNRTIDELQNATASYCILENEYHRQENELADLEHDYNNRLEKLHIILENQGNSLTRLEADDSGTDSSSADYTSDFEDEMPSQMAEYLSLVGEARILAERLSRLETEYLIRVEHCKQRQRPSNPLHNGTMSFFVQYPGAKARIESELELAHHKVRSHPEHTKQSARRDEEADEDDEDEIMQPFFTEEIGDQKYNDPLRSSEFEDPSPFFASAHTQPVNKRAFVDRWLLHRLRHSRFEIMRFKSAPELVELTTKGLRSDNISKMAMMFWFQDGAGTMEHIGGHSGG